MERRRLLVPVSRSKASFLGKDSAKYMRPHRPQEPLPEPCPSLTQYQGASPGGGAPEDTPPWLWETSPQIQGCWDPPCLGMPGEAGPGH